MISSKLLKQIQTIYKITPQIKEHKGVGYYFDMDNNLIAIYDIKENRLFIKDKYQNLINEISSGAHFAADDNNPMFVPGGMKKIVRDSVLKGWTQMDFPVSTTVIKDMDNINIQIGTRKYFNTSNIYEPIETINFINAEDKKGTDITQNEKIKIKDANKLKEYIDKQIKKALIKESFNTLEYTVIKVYPNLDSFVVKTKNGTYDVIPDNNVDSENAQLFIDNKPANKILKPKDIIQFVANTKENDGNELRLYQLKTININGEPHTVKLKTDVGNSNDLFLNIVKR